MKRDKQIQLGETYKKKKKRKRENQTRSKMETFKEREANDAVHALGSPRPQSSLGLWSEGRISSVLSVSFF